MAEWVRMGGATVVAFVVTFALTPVARTVALRTGFMDGPTGYKRHDRATPILGGTAVATGMFVSDLAFARGLDHLWLILACATLLLAVGTLDDRVGLGIWPRLSAQAAVALVLWAFDLGWTFGPTAVDLAVTLLWVVGLVNAFNLMDNLDGAAASVALASAAGVAAVALEGDQVALAAFALSLAGACAGFLPHNLARPSRIFLGDGGSTVIGFGLAVATMALPNGDPSWTMLLVCVPLVGLAVFDTTLVIVSRSRNGRPVLSGGRDHLTHRLLGLAGSPHLVATVLVVGQLALCALALWLIEQNDGAVAAVAGAYVVLGFVAIAAFERPPFVPREAERPPPLASQEVERPALAPREAVPSPGSES